MVITINISAHATVDGKFLPKFSFTEWAGSHVTTIPYNFNNTFETKDEALKVARAHAIREAREQYGPDAQVQIKEEV